VFVFHIAWSITASLRATPTRAFLNPQRFASRRPHAFSREKRTVLVVRIQRVGLIRAMRPGGTRRWSDQLNMLLMLLAGSATPTSSAGHATRGAPAEGHLLYWG
jgi:hypothetical protein